VGVWPRRRVRTRQGDDGVSPALVALALTLALVGCSSSSMVQGRASPTAVSSGRAVASTGGDALAAENAAVNAYRGFWEAKVSAHADPSKRMPPELRTYAIDKALTDEESAVFLYRIHGIKFQGRPILNPSVTSVRLTPTPPNVYISDCVDSSKWLPVFVASGRSALAPGQPARIPIQAMATTYDGRWVIRTFNAFRGRPC
jgi:hypothetical protein